MSALETGFQDNHRLVSVSLPLNFGRAVASKIPVDRNR